MPSVSFVASDPRFHDGLPHGAILHSLLGAPVSGSVSVASFWASGSAFGAFRKAVWLPLCSFKRRFEALRVVAVVNLPVASHVFGESRVCLALVI